MNHVFIVVYDFRFFIASMPPLFMLGPANRFRLLVRLLEL